MDKKLKIFALYKSKVQKEINKEKSKMGAL